MTTLKPLKTFWKSESRKHKMENPNMPITKTNFTNVFDNETQKTLPQTVMVLVLYNKKVLDGIMSSAKISVTDNPDLKIAND